MATTRTTLALVAIAATLSGCAANTQLAADGFKRPPTAKLAVMRPEVLAGVLTTGGMFERREDWSQQALDNVVQAVTKFESESASRVPTKIVMSVAETGADPALVTELTRLHDAVGQSIKLHKYAGQILPTKKDKFDWTLGEGAVQFGNQTKYDYALFLFAQDSFASGGRKALVFASLVTCGVVGVCAATEAGSQVAFASLVDLKSGKVVWFNTLYSGSGDIRTTEGADALVRTLLSSSR